MDIGFSEVIVIALLIIILFGPNKIPSIARDLGTGVRKMKGAVEDIKTEILKETDNPISEIKREIEKVKSAANEYNPLSDIQNPLASDENTSKQNNQLNDEYSGPVSRK